MGLTIHYQLKFRSADADMEDTQARWLVEEARSLAKKFKRQGRVETVGPLLHDYTACKLAEHYLHYRHPEYGEQWTEVLPREAWMFVVDPGEDCEPLRLGLARYRRTVRHLGADRRTKLDRGWGLSGFTKTQYASLHGWEHFLRCHRAVIDLLSALRPLGFRVRIADEGEYWPRRSTTALRRNVGQMNGIVAAAAGALKDAYGGDGAGIQSPIFAHQDFERLEAEGANQAGERLKILPALLQAAQAVARPTRQNP